MTSTGKVKWGNLNRVALIQEWCNSKEYQDWLMLVIDQLVKKKRNIFVFGDSRAFLLSLYERCVAKYGQKYTGIFLGKGPVLEGEKDVSWQRDTALAKPITFATYGVARKALDVVAKDAAILATPISDARQVAGRIRRVAKDKAQPILLVPVAMKIKMFRDAWNKIKLQFEAAGWEIKLCS